MVGSDLAPLTVASAADADGTEVCAHCAHHIRDTLRRNGLLDRNRIQTGYVIDDGSNSDSGTGCRGNRAGPSHDERCKPGKQGVMRTSAALSNFRGHR